MKCTGFSVLKEIMQSLGIRITKDQVTITKHPCFWVQHFKSEPKDVIETWTHHMSKTASVVVKYEDLMLNMNETVRNLVKKLDFEKHVSVNDITLRCIEYGIKYHDLMIFFSNLENAFIHGVTVSPPCELMEALGYPIVLESDNESFARLNNLHIKIFRKNINYKDWENYKEKINRGVKITTIENIWGRYTRELRQSPLKMNVFMLCRNCEEDLALLFETFEIILSVYNYDIHFYIFENDSNDLTDNIIVDWMETKKGSYRSVKLGADEKSGVTPKGRESDSHFADKTKVMCDYRNMCKSLCQTWDSEVSLVIDSNVKCTADIIMSLLMKMKDNVCVGHPDCFLMKTWVLKKVSWSPKFFADVAKHGNVLFL